MARFYAPSTIFIDEIDSIGGSREKDGEHEASRRLKSELLIQMDGVGTAAAEKEGENKMVIVLGATNHPWELDDALRRRLEKRIYIPLPDLEARVQLLKINLKEVKLDASVNMEELAKDFDGYSGADITQVCRDACFAQMRNKIRGLKPDQMKNLSKEELDLPVTKSDFEKAKARIQPSVNAKDVQRYEGWMKEFGAA
mmetsp:Transcript_11975/g.16591  ORF Transcript_11975/g.16591 Transcript_11975/m.16591 type:complete len:198 (+) Transcript_11975:3-596(+)